MGDTLSPMHPLLLSSYLAELELIEKRAAQFGKNVGRNYGRTSAKGGMSTSYVSAGVKATQPNLPKRKLPNFSGAKVPRLKPVLQGEKNNQVNLRRGLSNIETPD